MRRYYMYVIYRVLKMRAPHVEHCTFEVAEVLEVAHELIPIDLWRFPPSLQ